MPPRTVALIGAVCLTIGWLLASVLTPPVARLQMLRDARSPQLSVSSQAPEPLAEQLQVRLRHLPDPPSPRRNPFAFGGRPQRSQTESVAADLALVAPSPPPLPTGPPFSLSGIAGAAVPGGLVHTAVLSDGQTVHLVNAGETIGGYNVIEVTETSVTLEESSGRRYVLQLR